MFAGIVGLSPVIHAHHSHGAEFALDQDTTVEGVVESISFQNPHVMITLRAADGIVYSVEWQGAMYLGSHEQFVLPVARPVSSDTLHAGDRLIVIGAPAKDPTRHAFAVLKDVRRPLDSWEWTCDIPARRIRCGRGS